MSRMRRVGPGASGSSVPGGVFGAAPEAQNRDRLDGMAGGRANSSSISGGIFGTDDAPAAGPARGRRHASDSSISGGIFGGTGSNANDGFVLGGGYGGGYTKQSASVWEGAAGGRSTNAAQARDGHFRGGTVGQDRYAANTINPAQAQISGRQSFNPDFLANLEAAEQRDNEEAELLAQLQEEGLDAPASEEEAVIAAAEQLAEEMGLDDAAAAALEEKLLANHRASKQTRRVDFQQAPPPSAAEFQQAPEQYMPRANTFSNDASGFADQFGAAPYDTFGGSSKPMDGFKPSSKVLAPPGGASSICFG